MEPSLRALIASLFDDVAYHMDGLAGGQMTTDDWQQSFSRSLLTYHYAAYMDGSGSTTVPADARRRLNEAIGQQVERLNLFADAIDGREPTAADTARLQLYANAIRSSFWMGKVGVSLPVYPGACPDCWSNCRCSIEKRDDGYHWNAANDKGTCAGCRQRGADWQPYKE